MKFLISEEEKSRILNMHQNATSKHYLSEETPAKPTPTTRPTVAPLYGAAGTSTITFQYDETNNLITVQGSAKTPDGSSKALIKYTDVPENISTIIKAFMSRNGFEGKQPQLQKDLESRLTELKGKIDVFRKSKPTQK